MGQDATSEGDLRNTGVPLRHDREWSYKLEQIVETIKGYDAKHIGFQLPEGPKRRGPAVADDLRQLYDDDVTFMPFDQLCYDTYDLDTYLMRRADVFAHLGHSPMKESDKITYVPLFSSADPLPTMEDALDDIEGDEADLVTTAQHMNRFEDMCDWFEERGYTVQARKGDGHLAYEGQILGRNYASADTPADDVLYVGGGKFHPPGLAVEHPNKNVAIADPINNIVTIADAREFMKQHYASVHKAMDAEKWDVIFCTKIGQGRTEITKKILEGNENAYLTTTDEATPDRPWNFGMDAFVNTGCPRITTDDGPRFHKPILTLQEYRIAVGGEPLDVLRFDTFHGTW